VKAAVGRFGLMGPRPRMPPRHVMMQLINRMQMAFMRPRQGSVRGQFPFPPMFGDPQKFGIDPALLHAFSQSLGNGFDDGSGELPYFVLLFSFVTPAVTCIY
jgi:hypothetical protein